MMPRIKRGLDGDDDDDDDDTQRLPYVYSEHLVRNVQIDVIVVKQVSMNIAHSERTSLHCRLS